MTTDLAPFEGNPVVSTAIKVTKTGDGLSPAMKVDPAEYELDERVFVLIEGRVADIHFPQSKDNPDARIRQHVIEATGGTILEPSIAEPLVAAQRKRIEEAEGVQQLPGLDEEADD